MSAQTTSILTNKDVIAIDQDTAGIAAFRYYSFDGLEIWVKPLANGDVAVCFLNRSKQAQNVNYEWAAHQIQDNVAHKNLSFTQQVYQLKNLWTGKMQGKTSKAFKQTIAAHDVVMLRLIKSKS